MEGGSPESFHLAEAVQKCQQVKELRLSWMGELERKRWTTTRTGWPDSLPRAWPVARNITKFCLRTMDGKVSFEMVIEALAGMPSLLEFALIVSTYCAFHSVKADRPAHCPDLRKVSLYLKSNRRDEITLVKLFDRPTLNAIERLETNQFALIKPHSRLDCLQYLCLWHPVAQSEIEWSHLFSLKSTFPMLATLEFQPTVGIVQTFQLLHVGAPSITVHPESPPDEVMQIIDRSLMIPMASDFKERKLHLLLSTSSHEGQTTAMSTQTIADFMSIPPDGFPNLSIEVIQSFPTSEPDNYR